MNIQKKSILLLALLLLIILGVLKMGVFSVREIIVLESGCLSREKITSSLNAVGKNIFLIGQKETTDLLQKERCLKSLEIKKVYPQTLKILAEARKPLVRLSKITHNNVLDLSFSEASLSSRSALIDWSVPESQDSEFEVMDSSGIIFSKISDFSLPILFTDSDFETQKNLDKNLGEFLDKIINFLKLAQNDESIRSLESDFSTQGLKLKQLSSSLIVYTSPKVLLSLNLDQDRQVASLQLILQKAKIDQKMIESVDLRFEKPLVIYRPK
ncbi:MAG: hypothetical protein Q7S88_03520 [Candidatus Daviesbacteria bacterium]|nr:hypothetical protein [Candidatus Daviesbacteria bacterium]